MSFLFHTVGRHVSLVHLCEYNTVILHKALSANFSILFLLRSTCRYQPTNLLGIVITRMRARVTSDRAFTFHFIVRELPSPSSRQRENLSRENIIVYIYHISTATSRHFSMKAHTFVALRRTINWNEICSKQLIEIYLWQSALYCIYHAFIRTNNEIFGYT